jgi:DNA-binding MarR family transcriptional regulator
MRPATMIAEVLFDEAIKRSGLTRTQTRVLAAVERGDFRSQIELATATNVDRTTLSRVLRRLTHKGLVRRWRESYDTRAVAVALTTKGAALFAEIRATATYAESAAEQLVSTIEREIMGPFAAPPCRSTTTRA